MPSSIAAGPVDVLQRETNDLLSAASRTARQQRGRRRRESLTFAAGCLLDEPISRKIGQAEKADRCGVELAATTFEQPNQRPVLRRIGSIHDRAAGVHLAVRIGATIEQDRRYVETLQSGADMQRLAP